MDINCLYCGNIRPLTSSTAGLKFISPSICRRCSYKYKCEICNMKPDSSVKVIVDGKSVICENCIGRSMGGF